MKRNETRARGRGKRSDSMLLDETDNKANQDEFLVSEMEEERRRQMQQQTQGTFAGRESNNNNAGRFGESSSVGPPIASSSPPQRKPFKHRPHDFNTASKSTVNNNTASFAAAASIRKNEDTKTHGKQNRFGQKNNSILLNHALPLPPPSRSPAANTGHARDGQTFKKGPEIMPDEEIKPADAVPPTTLMGATSTSSTLSSSSAIKGTFPQPQTASSNQMDYMARKRQAKAAAAAMKRTPVGRSSFTGGKKQEDGNMMKGTFPQPQTATPSQMDYMAKKRQAKGAAAAMRAATRTPVGRAPLRSSLTDSNNIKNESEGTFPQPQTASSNQMDYMARKRQAKAAAAAMKRTPVGRSPFTGGKNQDDDKMMKGTFPQPQTATPSQMGYMAKKRQAKAAAAAVRNFNQKSTQTKQGEEIDDQDFIDSSELEEHPDEHLEPPSELEEQPDEHLEPPTHSSSLEDPAIRKLQMMEDKKNNTALDGSDVGKVPKTKLESNVSSGYSKRRSSTRGSIRRRDPLGTSALTPSTTITYATPTNFTSRQSTSSSIQPQDDSTIASTETKEVWSHVLHDGNDYYDDEGPDTIQPGAVRYGGIDAPNNSAWDLVDDLYYDTNSAVDQDSSAFSTTLESTVSGAAATVVSGVINDVSEKGPKVAVARIVLEDEEDEDDDDDSEALDLVNVLRAQKDEDDGKQEDDPENQKKDITQAKGIVGWIANHSRLAIVLAILIIGGIIGGIVAAVLTSGGDDVTPTAAAPSTMAPTSSPTTARFGQFFDVASLVTSPFVLLDPTSPQFAALEWLLDNDTFFSDVDDETNNATITMIDDNSTTPTTTMNNSTVNATGTTNNNSTTLSLLSRDEKILQRYGLATFYFATQGPNWDQQLNFLSSNDECDWIGLGTIDGDVTIGVKCDENGTVRQMIISENGLGGTIPNEIVALTKLNSLSLVRNEIKGTIPSTIELLTDLTDIRILSNAITGSFPVNLGALSELTHLAVQSNEMTGTIPSSIGNLTLLQNWFMHENEFVGTLPSEIGNLVNLNLWDASNNMLSGQVPPEVSNLRGLVRIELQRNSFTGSFEAFCGASAGLTTFFADCMTDLAFRPPEVECSCCSTCCADLNTVCS